MVLKRSVAQQLPTPRISLQIPSSADMTTRNASASRGARQPLSAVLLKPSDPLRVASRVSGQGFPSLLALNGWDLDLR